MVVGGREMTNVTQHNGTPASTHCPIFVHQSTDHFHFFLTSTFIDATHRSTLPSIPTHCLGLLSKPDFDFASAPERFLCLGTWPSGWHRTWIFFHERQCALSLVARFDSGGHRCSSSALFSVNATSVLSAVNLFNFRSHFHFISLFRSSVCKTVLGVQSCSFSSSREFFFHSG
jgi:hypothetical protein